MQMVAANTKNIWKRNEPMHDVVFSIEFIFVMERKKLSSTSIVEW